MTTAKEKKAMKELVWMSGWRFWNTLVSISPAMMNMKGSVWVQTFNEMSMILNRHSLRASYCVCIICLLCQEGYL